MATLVTDSIWNETKCSYATMAERSKQRKVDAENRQFNKSLRNCAFATSSSRVVFFGHRRDNRYPWHCTAGCICPLLKWTRIRWLITFSAPSRRTNFWWGCLQGSQNIHGCAEHRQEKTGLYFYWWCTGNGGQRKRACRQSQEHKSKCDSISLHHSSDGALCKA